MDRDNKLSIVIGFGLLIFVGMLVADHFSTATHREVATLGGQSPTPPPIPASHLINGSLPPLETIFPSTPSGDRFHSVQPGDSLRTICRSVYGDSGLANSVARWNGIKTPSLIEIGQRISLPSRTVLLSAPQNEVQAQTPLSNQKETEQFGTYTVKSGDTLSEIAQKLGSVKLTPLLIKLNKQTMPNPDRLQVGMKLRYPLD
ncbi:LysM peptidoglycan-binding domain-containing protein [PVC group bacterium]|nr:LysM peptidoglycan-binding domain-containing protein [PVC group bacterium]